MTTPRPPPLLPLLHLALYLASLSLALADTPPPPRAVRLIVRRPVRGEWVSSDVTVSLVVHWDTERFPALCLVDCRCADLALSADGARVCLQQHGAAAVIPSPVDVCFSLHGGEVPTTLTSTAAVPAATIHDGFVGCVPFLPSTPITLTGVARGTYRGHAELRFAKDLGGEVVGGEVVGGGRGEDGSSGGTTTGAFSFQVVDPLALEGSNTITERECGGGGSVCSSHTIDKGPDDGFAQLRTVLQNVTWAGASVLELNLPYLKHNNNHRQHHRRSATDAGAAGLFVARALLLGAERGWAISSMPAPAGVRSMKGFQGRAGVDFRDRRTPGRLRRLLLPRSGEEKEKKAASFDIVVVQWPPGRWDADPPLAIIRLVADIVVHGHRRSSNGSGVIIFHRVAAKEGNGGGSSEEGNSEEGHSSTDIDTSLQQWRVWLQEDILPKLVSEKVLSPSYTTSGEGSGTFLLHPYSTHVDGAEQHAATTSRAQRTTTHTGTQGRKPIDVARELPTDPAHYSNVAGGGGIGEEEEEEEGGDSVGISADRCSNNRTEVDFNFGRGANVITGCNICVRPEIVNGDVQVATFLLPPSSLASPSTRASLQQPHFGFKYGWSFSELDPVGNSANTSTSSARWYGSTAFVRPPFPRHTTHFIESVILLYHATRFIQNHPWLRSVRRLVLINVPRNDIEYNQRFLRLLRAAMTAEHGSAVVNAMAYELWFKEDFHGAAAGSEGPNNRPVGGAAGSDVACFGHVALVGMVSQDFGMFADRTEASAFRSHAWHHLALLPPEPRWDRSNAPMNTLLLERTGTRVILNADDVRRHLQRTGLVHFDFLPWTERDMAQLSFREQVESMRSADVVIGAHGSGLVNAIFLAPGSVVIEAFPTDFVRFDWHHHLVSAGMHYLLLLVGTAGGRGGAAAMGTATPELCLPTTPSMSMPGERVCRPCTDDGITAFEAGSNECRDIRNHDFHVDKGQLEALIRQADFLIRNLKRGARRRVSSGGGRYRWGRGRRADGSFEPLGAPLPP